MRTVMRSDPPATDVGDVGVSGFCRAAGVTSEYDYKRRCVAVGKVMYHAHIGLATWSATYDALREIVTELSADGKVLDRRATASCRLRLSETTSLLHAG